MGVLAGAPQAPFRISLSRDKLFAFDAGLFYTFYMKTYAMFDHTADIGVEIIGRTKKELFAHAAGALMDILFGPPVKNQGRLRKEEINVEGADEADLLINFLREILYLVNGGGWIVRNIEVVRCSNKRLTAEFRLEASDPKRRVQKTEIKAVTYHGLSVVKERSGWRARVIFDV